MTPDPASRVTASRRHGQACRCRPRGAWRASASAVAARRRGGPPTASPCGSRRAGPRRQRRRAPPSPPGRPRATRPAPRPATRRRPTAPAGAAARATRCATRRPAARRRRAEARWSWAASCGACSAALRTRTLSTGLRLCGIVEEPPRPAAAPSRSSPISGRDSEATSVATTPSASVVAQRAADLVTGPRRVCHGRPGQRRPSSSAKGRATAAGSVVSASSASVPAAPPHCTGSVAGPRRRRRRRVDRGEPLRGLQAEGGGHGVLGERAAQSGAAFGLDHRRAGAVARAATPSRASFAPPPTHSSGRSAAARSSAPASSSLVH